MNKWSLTFPTLIDYRAYDEITVKVDLTSGASSVTVNAKLDCGSKFCVFQPHHAQMLGLELKSGVPERIRTAAGSFPAYGHEITLTVGEWNGKQPSTSPNRKTFRSMSSDASASSIIHRSEWLITSNCFISGRMKPPSRRC